MSESNYSFQLEFRGFPSRIFNRFSKTLHKEMVGVIGSITNKFPDAKQFGFSCRSDVGQGSVCFTGDVDTSKILPILHKHFQNTRLLEPMNAEKGGFRKLPEMMQVKDDLVPEGRGFDFPQDVPKFYIIEVPENS